MFKYLLASIAILMLWVLPMWVRDIFEISAWRAHAFVYFIAMVLSVLIGAIAVKISDRKENDRRFEISTMMLVAFFLAVQFALLRVSIEGVARKFGRLTNDQLIGACVIYMLTACAGTVALLCLTEVIVRAANRILLLSRRSARNASR